MPMEGKGMGGTHDQGQGREEKQGGNFPILLAGICVWQVKLAHRFVELIYPGSQKQKQSFM